MPVDDFVAELTAHADRADLPALTPIIERLCRPVSIRTLGRPGVGRRTVTAALSAAGLTTVDTDPDVDVLVIAEVAKPEDCRVCADAGGPILVVLNKADLLGAAAAERAALMHRRTGTPTIPMAALLAARQRRSSNIDEVLAGVSTAAAVPRYRRLQIAMTQLRALAARTGDESLAALLAGDGAVYAAMNAASAVLGPPAAHGDPVYWQRYGRGPVTDLHRRCAADMTRGALRSLRLP